MKTLLDYRLLIPLVIVLGFAPFFPQPHIVGKVRMPMAGTLKRSIDIFDYCRHAWPVLLLAVRVDRDIVRGADRHPLKQESRS